MCDFRIERRLPRSGRAWSPKNKKKILVGTVDRLQRRLEGYWRMELLNAALLPCAAMGLLAVADQAIGPLSISCFIPMSALLIVGGCYWRTKSRRLTVTGAKLDATMLWLDWLHIPLLVGCVSTSLLCVADLIVFRISVSDGDRLVAIIAVILSNLEYVNYYHRQVQHFDHTPDFLRLLSGRGFRKSHMRADLERFRARRRSG